jgi:hypothetical protein
MEIVKEMFFNTNDKTLFLFNDNKQITNLLENSKKSNFNK